jgi:hypothetical protein
VAQHGLQAVEATCKTALLQGGCNDAVILDYLKPRVEEVLEEVVLLKLSFPPTEDCRTYNQAYLPQTMNGAEAYYAA